MDEEKSGDDDGDSTFSDQVFSAIKFNRILSTPSVKSKNFKQKHNFLEKFGSYSFINISEGREEVDDVGHSRRNMVEVAVLINILRRLQKEWQCYGQKLSVCVLSPYVAQVKEIERRVHKIYEELDSFELKVESVEGSQVSEADVVILSTVRSNFVGSVGSTLAGQRSNVALTRTRQCFWILGNGKTLSEVDSVWKEIVSDAKERKCFYNAEEDEEFAQVIINVRSKLDELEELLDKDSIIFKSARWKVVFSEIFVKSFSKLPSTYSKKLVVKFLLKLANGWRPKNKKTDVVCESSVRIAKQFKVEGRYIICTNDVSKVQGYATQILKVWDILHLKDVPALVNKLDKIYGAFSDDFLLRCKEKYFEGCLEVPRCYTSCGVSQYKNIINTRLTSSLDPDKVGRSSAEHDKVKESLLLTKFYSLSAGVLSHLLSASDGTVLNVPFEVSDEEREMILNPRSTFILGRSGTGKTTVLVMKLFQKEQQHHMASEGFNVNEGVISGFLCNQFGRSSLCQLFVTVNPKLCFAVKQHINNLRRFVHGENFGEGCIPIDVNDMDEYEKFKDVPDSLEEIPPNVYPLVLTLNMFLLMLDRTLGSSYFDRFPDIRKIHSMETASPRLAVQTVRRKEVTYEKFRTSYWSHFNSQLTRDLDSSRVFTEINSCIKGSLHNGKNDDANLSLQSYLQLSQNRISNFREDEREMIYQIFENYEKNKVARGEFDLADLVNDLHRRLRCEKYEGEIMDFVYIDEVQDLTMKQLALFKYMCNNVEEGFVFAGDTAQTIARGVDFRFEDIKCLFYMEFLRGDERENDKGIISPMSHLSQNFRTHAGVVNLAQSVIDLIYHFFPNSIDRLKPETSLLCGELPILLVSETYEDAIVKIFQDRGRNNGNSISFGSDQVIMVRDDYARDKIANKIGTQALVLTIFECKGLEFEDVLLYNFFGSSPLQEQWRIIYEYMKKVLCLSNPETYPSFTNARHNVLCYELKQLYVAITRTRQRLWICEDSDECLSPMVDYWKKLNLIQVKRLDDSFAQTMRVASTLEDWRWRGIKMLEVHNYKAATQSFERAGDFNWENFARASDLKATAENLRALRLEESLQMLREAAKIFENIKNIKKAAECYFDAEDYETAGRLYLEESELQQAGQCYTLAGCYGLAAKVYSEGYYFHECLYCCLEGRLFNLGLHYIRSWKQHANLRKFTKGRVDLNAREQEFLLKCALESHKQHNSQAMMNYVKDFNSLESMRTFLKKLGCFGELTELEAEYGNFQEAAKSARQMGNILLEADMLAKGGFHNDASQLYIAYVFASSLWADGNKGWPLKEFSSKNNFLSKAKAHARSCSNYFYEAVLESIQYLRTEDLSLTELHKQLSRAQKHNNLRGQIVSARRILDMLLARDIPMYKRGRDMNRNLKRPVEKLIHHWNFWKEKIENIYKYLDSLDVQGTCYFPDYEEFCLEYLGVRKRSINSDDYFLLYPDAEWVKFMLRKSDKIQSISARQLVHAASSYWCAEILSVGMKLLMLLESFQKLVVGNSNSWILIHIFEAAEFVLSKCRFVKLRNNFYSFLMSYIDLSAEDYFLHVYSLNWRMFLSKDLAIQSNSSRNQLKEAILKRLVDEVVAVEGASPTFSQVIQVAVILLGSSCEANENFKEITVSFKINSPWSTLIKDLMTGTGRQTLEGNMQLVRNLCDALREAYNSIASLQQECNLISPSCFIYLLDRLLVLVSCFNGCLYATRSSVIEWLVHLNWKVDRKTFVFSDFELKPIYDFLAHTIHELLMNKQGTEDWIKKVGFDVKNSYGLLILKLLVLMCLIHLNSGKYLELLNDVFNRSDILSLLPNSFSRVFIQRDGSTFCNVLSEALQSIKDPLVAIRNAEICSMVHAKRAVFLNVFNCSRDTLLEKVFRSQ